VVGVPEVHQQIPLTVIVPPPSEVISPPQAADTCVKRLMPDVVIEGRVTGVVVLPVSFLQLPANINNVPIAINDKIRVEVLILFININLNDC
jgi:hypothetical protein